MSKEMVSHMKISDAEFSACDFSFSGTIISGANQEIDVYRPDDDEFGDIEIRVTLVRNKTQMDFSSISLTDQKGAPIIIVNIKCRDIDFESAEVLMFEAIEYDNKALEYSYGRSPYPDRVPPGTFIPCRKQQSCEPQI